MHQRSLSELQGVPLQQETSTLRTAQKRVSVLSSALRSGHLRLPQSSMVRRGSVHCLCPQRVSPLWAWLLLGALVVPGTFSFLSEEQEELLVELHNHYRGQVSPHASAMLPLRWDASLKVIAEGYAAKCHWTHNPELEETGENLFAGTGPLDLRVALEKWFMEYLDYDYHNNSCHEDKMCGHYTQMVWADTHRVGCAFHLCNTMEGLDWDRVSFLVCNYYPPGNYEWEKPYEEGDWCSRCPENLQKCENYLCVADNEEEEEEEEEVEEEDVTAVPPSATSELFTKLDTTPHQGTPSTPRTTTTSSSSSSSGPDIKHLDPPTTPGEEKKQEEDEDEEEEGRKDKEKVLRDRTRMKSSSSSSSLSVLLVSLTAILILSL